MATFSELLTDAIESNAQNVDLKAIVQSFCVSSSGSVRFDSDMVQKLLNDKKMRMPSSIIKTGKVNASVFLSITHRDGISVGKRFQGG